MKCLVCNKEIEHDRILQHLKLIHDYTTTDILSLLMENWDSLNKKILSLLEKMS